MHWNFLFGNISGNLGGCVVVFELVSWKDSASQQIQAMLGNWEKKHVQESTLSYRHEKFC